MEPRFFDVRARDIARYGVPTVLLLLAVAWLFGRYVEPAPPRTITISTGSETGAYFAFGKRYAEILAKSGVTLKVLTSEGSAENYARLNDASSGVDVALMQGGLKGSTPADHLVSLGRMFPQPIWVFYRSAETWDTLNALKGKRISPGPIGSGTQLLATKLLAKSGIDATTATIQNLSVKDSGEGLKKGELDAIFLALAPETPLIQELLRNPDIQLMSMAHAEAYTRILPFLAHTTLPRGMVDIERNIPPRDVDMIANEAALVVRATLHPALIGLLAEAAHETHAGGGLFQRIGAFPRPTDPEFTMAEDAVRYYKSGHPFLQRYLPFWIANFIERTAIILLPVLTILYPVMRTVPIVYQWRIRRRFLRYFAKLKKMERQLDGQPDGGEIAALKSEIGRIGSAISHLPVPVNYIDKYYELRAAIELVRARIEART
jgi:TRAP transporter TAXI family solute receptor